MMISFGDLAQSFLLKSQTSRLKSEVGRVTQELSSGRLSNVGSALSGDHSRLAGVSRSMGLASGYLEAAKEAAFRTGAMQAAISLISTSAQDLTPELLSAPQSGSTDALALATTNANQRLATALSALNTDTGGRALFAGTSVGSVAVVDADTVLTALRTEIAGSTTADEAMTRIAMWFNSPTGYSDVAYSGGPPEANLAISPDDSVWLGVTANDAAFKEVIKGFAAAALIGDIGQMLSERDTSAFARLAGETLHGGTDALIQLGAKIGISESRIDTAISRNSSEMLTLEMALGDMVESDPYTLALELEAVQTNLETLYSVTARLSRLNLTDYIR